MPAKHSRRVDSEGVYAHIYNRGIAKRIIFHDDQDYRTFISYLHEYLTPPSRSDGVKTSFTVRGHTFKGVPHQSRNYYNKVYLIAFSLWPNHFHLLLRQNTQGSLQKFIRSLCTRYAIYFNKKYERTGSVFEGPYKSTQISSSTDLLYLTHYFHGASNDKKDITNFYSSYADYVSDRKNLWVNPEVVLSYFEKSEKDLFKGVGGYRNFIEKYTLDQKENHLLARIILENESSHLEKNQPILERNTPSEEIPVSPNLGAQLGIPQFALAMIVYILLFSIGFKNILASTPPTLSPLPTASTHTEEKNSNVDSNGLVAGVMDTQPMGKLTIKIVDVSRNASIYKRPTRGSEKIGEAMNGQVFEFVSVDSGWYEIKLTNGSTGFVPENYIEIIKNSTN